MSHDHEPRERRLAPDHHAAVGNAPGVTELWRSPDPDDEPDLGTAVVRIAGATAPSGAAAGLAGVSRRGFLATIGAGAGALGLAGCVRRPLEKIFPFADRPEDRIPGKPVHYATSLQAGGTVLGLLVESFDGRPTKIEGNPKHPETAGAASALAQAAVRDLYDGDRSAQPLRGGSAARWDDFWPVLDQAVATARGRAGAGLALLLRDLPSPTLARLVGELRTALPQARCYVHDATHPSGAAAALAAVAGAPSRAYLRLAPARVIAALDADLLGADPDALRHSRELAAGRRLHAPTDSMNRLYAVEPSLTVTGMTADHRLPVAGSQVARVLQALAHELFAGQGLPAPAGAAALVEGLAAPTLAPGAARFVKALARDLAAHRGASLVAVGARQPAAVHALGYLVNLALGNVGTTLTLRPDAGPLPGAPGLAELRRALLQGEVQTLLVLGGNPVYEAPGDLDFAAALRKAATTIHLGARADETGRRCTWHLPLSHPLESWGDLRASDGTVGVVQPLIAPLFDSRSEIEVLARLLGQRDARGYDLVRATWRGLLPGADFDQRWNGWLSDGVIAGAAAPAARPGGDLAALGKLLAASAAPAPPTAARLEADFRLGSAVYDGRHGNNGWLQELPDPVTKLVWDNAALLGPGTAAALGVRTGDLVALTAGGRTVEIPVFVQPGQAEGTVGLALGYGRTAGGRFADGHGVDVAPLRPAAAPWFVAGLGARPLGRRHELATTQRHGDMEGRPIIRSATLAQYRQNPDFAAAQGPPHPPLKSLWKEPNPRTGQQWGMAIDLTACTGCSACVVACQAENNIPVVGRDQVLRLREMHWIRIDRYYGGSPEAPTVAVQPVPCMQCENAPCEQVCPVAATNHSPSGLNDQVYNRCIGTRYCSNNCPYKVRHFNFFNYNEDLPLLDQMYKNPDVTVRGRGVMEKCTYCVQRINSARIAAKKDGRDQVADGVIVPACQQTCPTGAIVFGDINDPQSRVSRAKAQSRNYALLGELNTKPRTTYLAQVRNPNPELG